ncbi:MAG: cyclase family protein [Vallitaleaceae bacterium]|jgi:arylformamidase|nr:cyclase family protein [Vallitaleaceae bacterium]
MSTNNSTDTIIHDVSMTIYEGMKVYKNMPIKVPKITNLADYPKDGYHENQIEMNLHTGTHIDGPLHMIEGGSTTGIYPIEQMFGKARVIDLTKIEGLIEAHHLEGSDFSDVDFVLFKTRNSFDKLFNFEWIALSESAAKYLSQFSLKGVGIDALGIERAQPSHVTHKTLLRKSIMIIEGLALSEIVEGDYEFIVLPLKIQGVEGAPARAVLIERGKHE